MSPNRSRPSAERGHVDAEQFAKPAASRTPSAMHPGEQLVEAARLMAAMSGVARSTRLSSSDIAGYPSWFVSIARDSTVVAHPLIPVGWGRDRGRGQRHPVPRGRGGRKPSLIEVGTSRSSPAAGSGKTEVVAQRVASLDRR